MLSPRSCRRASSAASSSDDSAPTQLGEALLVERQQFAQDSVAVLPQLWRHARHRQRAARDLEWAAEQINRPAMRVAHGHPHAALRNLILAEQRGVVPHLSVGYIRSRE